MNSVSVTNSAASWWPQSDGDSNNGTAVTSPSTGQGFAAELFGLLERASIASDSQASVVPSAQTDGGHASSPRISDFSADSFGLPERASIASDSQASVVPSAQTGEGHAISPQIGDLSAESFGLLERASLASDSQASVVPSAQTGEGHAISLRIGDLSAEPFGLPQRASIASDTQASVVPSAQTGEGQSSPARISDFSAKDSGGSPAGPLTTVQDSASIFSQARPGLQRTGYPARRHDSTVAQPEYPQTVAATPTPQSLAGSLPLKAEPVGIVATEASLKGDAATIQSPLGSFATGFLMSSVQTDESKTGFTGTSDLFAPDNGALPADPPATGKGSVANISLRLTGSQKSAGQAWQNSRGTGYPEHQQAVVAATPQPLSSLPVTAPPALTPLPKTELDGLGAINVSLAGGVAPVPSTGGNINAVLPGSPKISVQTGENKAGLVWASDLSAAESNNSPADPVSIGQGLAATLPQTVPVLPGTAGPESRQQVRNAGQPVDQQTKTTPLVRYTAEAAPQFVASAPLSNGMLAIGAEVTTPPQSSEFSSPDDGGSVAGPVAKGRSLAGTLSQAPSELQKTGDTTSQSMASLWSSAPQTRPAAAVAPPQTQTVPGLALTTPVSKAVAPAEVPSSGPESTVAAPISAAHQNADPAAGSEAAGSTEDSVLAFEAQLSTGQSPVRQRDTLPASAMHMNVAATPAQAAAAQSGANGPTDALDGGVPVKTSISADRISIDDIAQDAAPVPIALQPQPVPATALEAEPKLRARQESVDQDQSPSVAGAVVIGGSARDWSETTQRTHESPAAPQQGTGLEPSRDETKEATPQPVREVSIRVTNDTQTADVRMVERNGEIQVAVHASNAGLANSLRADVGNLVSGLSPNGISAEISHQGSTSSSADSDSRREESGGGMLFQRQESQNFQQSGNQQRNGEQQSHPWFDELE